MTRRGTMGRRFRVWNSWRRSLEITWGQSAFICENLRQKCSSASSGNATRTERRTLRTIFIQKPFRRVARRLDATLTDLCKPAANIFLASFPDFPRTTEKGNYLKR